MKHFLNSRVAVVIIIIIFLVIAGKWIHNNYINLETDLKIAQQNQEALKDSIRITDNELKQAEFSKQILVAKNKSDVKNLNEKMSKKVKKLKGEISSLTSTIIRLESTIDSLHTKVITIKPADSTGLAIKAFSWLYERQFDEDNYRKIAGKTFFQIDTSLLRFRPIKTSITEDIIKFNITQGLRTTEEGKVEMFATSNYPNFEVEELNSILISPETHPALKRFTKKEKFRLAIYTGFGGTVNLSNYQMIFGPQVGVGGSWVIW